MKKSGGQPLPNGDYRQWHLGCSPMTAWKSSQGMGRTGCGLSVWGVLGPLRFFQRTEVVYIRQANNPLFCCATNIGLLKCTPYTHVLRRCAIVSMGAGFIPTGGRLIRPLRAFIGVLFDELLGGQWVCALTHISVISGQSTDVTGAISRQRQVSPILGKAGGSIWWVGSRGAGSSCVVCFPTYFFSCCRWFIFFGI